MSAAELSLWARVEDLTREDIRNALWKERSLVKSWCMRGTLHLMAASDYPLYVAGLRTRTGYQSKAWLKFYRLGLSDIESIIDGVRQALDGRSLSRQELAKEIGRNAKPRIRQGLESGWGSLLKPAAYQGNLCFGPSQGQTVMFVRPDQWLGRWDEPESGEAMKELLRRYLTSYGPATHEDFARWWGMFPGRARSLMKTFGGELEEVEVEGRKGWMPEIHAKFLKESSTAHSVRLLPNFDCYVMGYYPRGNLVPTGFETKVFRPQAWVSPVLLVDGRVAGIWEQRKKRNEILVGVQPFAPLSSSHKKLVEEEVAGLGEFLEAPAKAVFS